MNQSNSCRSVKPLHANAFIYSSKHHLVWLSTQWNIERGYKLHQIVQELKQIDADVIALQEVDIGCERSESIDTGDLCTDWGSH